MDNIQVPPQSPEATQNENLLEIIEMAENKLDEAGKISASRAFNLGCFIGLIPVLIFILIVILATRSWLAAIMSGILMAIALLGFANLVAIITRTNTMKKLYVDEISQQIDEMLFEKGMSRDDFNQYVLETLPASDILYEYLPKPDSALPSRPIIKLPQFRKRK